MLEINQIGGYLGSYAGDAGYILGPDFGVIIDWGSTFAGDGPGRTVIKALKNVLPLLNYKRKQAIITHFHRDHCGFADAPKAGAFMKKMGLEVYHFVYSGQGSAKTYYQKLFSKIPKNKVKQLTDTSPMYVLWNTTVEASDYRLALLLADPTGFNTKFENTYSGGAYLSVLSPGRTFSFLTTGDMDPKSSGPALGFVKKADVVKYPHHGSGGNWSNQLGKIIDTSKSHVLLSGFTQKDFDGVDNAINSHASGISVLLFDSISVSTMAQTTKFQQLYSQYEQFRVFDQVKITFNPADGKILMAGKEWSFSDKYPFNATLANQPSTIDITTREPMKQAQ